MCHKVIFTYQEIQHQVSFSSPNAKLPLLTKQGDMKLITWGRRRQQPGNLPLGGFAQLNEIQDGKWSPFFPRAVKLPIKAFLARDFEDQTQWFHLTSDKWIQGLLARYDRECRLYIVTLEPEPEQIYARWPRIITKNP